MSYTFFATNEPKGIRHHITCSSSNLVYMIQCTKCRIQYIRETKHRLCNRFGEHRRAVEKAITQRDIDEPTTVSDHFTLPGHSLNNLELIPLELINSNRGSPIGLAGCGICPFFAVIFGIWAEKRGGKREFQLLVGAGFRVFIGLGCEIGKGNRAG